ncbi:hypothetical protein RLDS_09415 [Sphingobium lactosutens DS20]|uniref:Uncharacterized protein n=1 Tax=Sphingobium lactosutens DS20 TaxID=1331060 RepID=T0IVR6_9SPHN|nr:hypothetical protein RLDS_09415 [Sphingobium lactosutens DS20]
MADFCSAVDSIIESAYFDENPPLIFHGGKFHVLPMANAA